MFTCVGYYIHEALTVFMVVPLLEKDKTENISLEIIEVILLWFERASFEGCFCTTS